MKEISNPSAWHAAGYEVHLRQGRWAECSIEGHGERWSGKGSSAEVAIEQALRKMAPSRLARRSIDLWLASLGAPATYLTMEHDADGAAKPTGPAEVGQAYQADASDGAGLAPREPPAPAEPGAPPASAAEAPAADDLPADGATATSALRPGASPLGDQALDSTAATALVDAAQAPTAVRAREPAAPTRSSRWDMPTSEAAFDAEIEDIRATIRNAEADFAVLSPRAMVLLMAVWIGRARGAEEAIGTKEAEKAVNERVIKPVRVLAKRYWPGALMALQLNALPSSLTEQLGMRPSSWIHAANVAADLFESLDNEGWAETNEPIVPQDVDSALAATVRDLDQALGATHGPEDRDADQWARAFKLTPAATDTLVRCGRRLRWLRAFLREGVPWGQAMGRLRWLAQQWRLTAEHPLVATLDATHRPAAGSWAEALGYDSKRIELRRRRRQIVASRPEPGADQAKIAEWFSDAALAYDADELEPLVRSLREPLAAIDPSKQYRGKAFGRVRDRLRRVLARLEAASKADASPAVGSTSEQLAAGVGDDASDAGDDELTPSTAPAIVAQAREIAAGRRTLVVGNRPDPHLQRALSDELGLAIDDWCDASHVRAVQSACDRIRGGQLDLVLALTGFMGHSTESMLRRAAGTSTPVLRCNRGRVNAVAHAVVRDLSLAAP